MTMAGEKERKATAYEIFLRIGNNWAHVSTIAAGNAQRALDSLVDQADADVDASGDYMVVPKGNVTFLRPQRKVTTAYDMEPFDGLAPAVELAEAPAPAEDDAA